MGVGGLGVSVVAQRVLTWRPLHNAERALAPPPRSGSHSGSWEMEREVVSSSSAGPVGLGPGHLVDPRMPLLRHIQKQCARNRALPPSLGVTLSTCPNSLDLL